MARYIPITLILITLAAVALTAWINYLAPHLFGEPDLSMGELLSVNWWHPTLRLLAIWLWIIAIVGWVGAGVAWLVGRRTARVRES